MSRKFYTPISLTGLELTNFKIQNLDSNPSPYGAGHAYYNTTAKEIRVYDGTTWNPVGGSIEYGLAGDIPAPGNAGRVYATTDTKVLYLDNGTLWLQIGIGTDTADTLSNKTLVEPILQGRLSLTDDSGTETAYFEHSYTGTTRLTASDDIAIRSVDGDIILYPGNDNGGPGRAYVHWGNDATGANPGNEITTAANSQTLTNKTLDNASVTGTTAFFNGNGDEGLSIDVSNIGTAHLIAADDLSLRATNDIILYPGNDAGGGATGKAYIHWGNDSTNSHPEREIATVGTSQTLTNKTLGSGVILDEDLNAEGYTITNLATPLNPSDAATKGYVDATAQGLSVLGAVKTASDVDIDLTSPIASVGGVSLSTGDRVLLKVQTDPTQNGIYIYDADGGWLTLSTNVIDQDLKEGSYTLVEEGNYAAQGWIVTAFSAGASTWTQFSAAGEYTAGNGITIQMGAISGVAKENGGLTLDGDGFAAYLGAGLTIDNAGAIAVVDYTYLTKKMAQTIGDTTNTSFDIYHNFGTQDVSVTIYDTSTGEEVFADVIHSNTSKINVTFAVAPGTDQFRVVVVG